MRPAQEQHTDVAISDSSEKTITKKIDFFMNSLQQEADRIGLVKEYAQSVKDATLLASARLEDLEARKSKAARQTKLSESLGISQEQYAQLVEAGSDSEELFVPVSDADNKDGKDDDAGNSDSDSEKGSESISAKPLPAKSVTAETPLRLKSVSAGPLSQSTSAFAGIPFHPKPASVGTPFQSTSASVETPWRPRPGQLETTIGRSDNSERLLSPHGTAPYRPPYHQMPPTMYNFGTAGTAGERHHFDPAAHQAMNMQGFNPATQPNMVRAHQPAYKMHGSSGFIPGSLGLPHHELANPYASSSSDSLTNRVSPSSSEASSSVSKASHRLDAV
ncbi:hypothetical protein LTR91_015920 [Friedmanniomyces endolithicus]|uniref:Uncharacterized protein n=1 Tax=Friedmanniomyces endolithicus TaxID=329885 RepID=A0AAN6K944_9PEZI|nr:hypothetical protein LTR75_016133 [Friedmanniomyces endolithicus]KAK0790642.1 hypothetical protein LTR59_009136 [Friedmanniomyces endolithicus]KAK0795276.1 hypothetical protein LTR38_008980 [Friedmanniomyces endolithicus]KAK0847110.1 hypothetical protein LTR03_006456 [Friedmanniomyces endolithicus]KAK0863087.1 hypothetical protein LTS02_006752 [Friedmanniomyces endolithicus]